MPLAQRAVLVTPLNLQGSEWQKPDTHCVVPRKALALTQPHLPHLQNGPHQLPSLPLAVREEGSAEGHCHPDFYPFSGCSAGGCPGRSFYGPKPFPHPDTALACCSRCLDRSQHPLTQFPQL